MENNYKERTINRFLSNFKTAYTWKAITLSESVGFETNVANVLSIRVLHNTSSDVYKLIFSNLEKCVNLTILDVDASSQYDLSLSAIYNQISEVCRIEQENLEYKDIYDNLL